MNTSTKAYNSLLKSQLKHEYVRAKIRELGRLLQVLKTEHSIQSIEHSINPSCFQHVLTSVRKVAGYDDVSGKYAVPSLALKLGHSLRKCAAILKSKGLQETNQDMEKKANAFQQLCEIEWSAEVSSLALRTLHAQKINKVTVMPLARDISKLSSYMAKTAETAMTQLQSAESGRDEKEGAWLSLAESTLGQVVMFNRRRSGEVSKMKLEDYKSATSIQCKKPILMCICT